MQSVSFDEVIDKIVAKDQRYDREAYHFVREALDFTQEKIKRSEKLKPHSTTITEADLAEYKAKRAEKEQHRHVSGQELLEGIRQHALQKYGPMAITLFGFWGIRQCEDFGEIVFNMVENNGLNKQEQDSRDDFKAGYNFDDAFRKPFLPSAALPKAAPEIKPT